jgi:LysM repeat protein
MAMTLAARREGCKHMFDSALDIEHRFGHHHAMHRTYVRRRVLATLVAACLAGAITVPLAYAAETPTVTNVSQRSYVVRSGDTLWSIAARLSVGSDPRPLIEAIERVDRVGAADIVPGERLVIPAVAG